MFTKLFSLVRSISKKTIIMIVFVLIIISLVLSRDSNGKQYFKVEREDIVQQVASTGKVKPAEEVDLGFDRSGRISGVYKKVGDSVKKGEIIVSLESGEVYADLQKAKAALVEENIKLKNIQINSPTNYLVAEESIKNSLRNAFAVADDSIRNKADQFFKNVSSNPTFEVYFEDGNFKHYFTVSNDVTIDLNSGRKNLEEVLVKWEKELQNLKPSEYLDFSQKTIEKLFLVSNFLDKMAAAVNSFSPVDFNYESVIDGYKTSINSARTSITSANSNVVNSREKFATAPTIIGSSFNNVLEQEARVSVAYANVSSLEALLSKYSIRAPFDGVITIQEAKIGAISSPGSPLVSIISNDNLYIEANISEVNIGKIKLDNLVYIDFDAFPGEEFVGRISFIEPGETIINGVVNYRVRIVLDKDANLLSNVEKIKQGLTANLRIETYKKKNVISIPLYVIKKENDKNYVELVIGKETVKKEIKLGIVGDNGNIEVISGLNDGDVISY